MEDGLKDIVVTSIMRVVMRWLRQRVYRKVLPLRWVMRLNTKVAERSSYIKHVLLPYAPDVRDEIVLLFRLLIFLEDIGLRKDVINQGSLSKTESFIKRMRK